MAKPVYSNSQVIDQIDSGWHWTSGGITATSITYGITTNNSWFPSNLPEYAGWSALNASQSAATEAAMELWTDLIAVDVIAADPNSADIRVSNTTTGISYAHAYYPGATNSDGSISQIAQGSVWLNPLYSSLSDPDTGEYGYMAIVHELGHAFGLGHPGTYNGGSPTYQNDAVYAQDTHQYTVMSYFVANQTGANWSANGVWHWAQTPMLHDILTIQSIYGADVTTRAGDTVYGFNSNAANAVFDFTQNLNPVLTIWDGGGTDTLDLSGWGTNSTISLVEGAFSNANSMTQNIAIAYGAEIENAVGGSGNDVIIGNSLNNILNGGIGTDMLFGGLGNDTLDGGAEADALRGEGGDDTYIVDSFGDLVFENAGEGTDTVQTSLSVYQLGANVENLVMLAGSTNGLGNDLANTITGSAAADVIYGGAGADTLIGGLGNDNYFIDDIGDVVIENPGEGWDRVQSTITIPVLFDNVEILTLLGSGEIDVMGNALDNVIFANAGINNLDGGAGNDLMMGGLGNDIMTGGTGLEADTMRGEAGDDTYTVDSIGDRVIENPGQGTNDSVFSSVSYMIGAWIENLTLTGVVTISGTGNGQANTITGNDGDNFLMGLGGADTLTGGAGNDVLVGGADADTYFFANGSGSDAINGFEAGAGAGDVAHIADFGFANFAAVQGAMSTMGADVLLTLDVDDFLLLRGHVIGDFAADDFILV